jgi:hypothetical protein
MRELLADMQMQQGEPAAALKAYEASMRATPMRLRAFYGAGKAAEAAGEKKKAAAYFGQLARLTRTADGDRAEVREARRHLASQ